MGQLPYTVTRRAHALAQLLAQGWPTELHVRWRGLVYMCTVTNTTHAHIGMHSSARMRMRLPPSREHDPSRCWRRPGCTNHQRELTY